MSAYGPRDLAAVEAACQVLGGKWKPMILWLLWDRPRRYSDLRRLIPEVSEKVLVQQLRKLEADGLVERRDFRQTPPRVEYCLTAYGQASTTALGIMREWGSDHLDRSGGMVRPAVAAMAHALAE